MNYKNGSDKSCGMNDIGYGVGLYKIKETLLTKDARYTTNF